MKPIRIKICGITRPEDALAAAEAGADAVGLVFYAKSKRAVTAVQAREITAVLPPFVSAVALFVNEQPDVIRQILRQVPIDVIQFHGDEDDDFCRQFDRPYLKAVRVQSAADIQTAWQHRQTVDFGGRFDGRERCRSGENQRCGGGGCVRRRGKRGRS